MLLRTILEKIEGVEYSEDEMQEIVDGIEKCFTEAEEAGNRIKKKLTKTRGITFSSKKGDVKSVPDRAYRFFWRDRDIRYLEFLPEEEAS